MVKPIASFMTDAAIRLAALQEGIARAAKAARRQPKDVTLIAVTKKKSSAEIEALIAAGVTDFGENRVGEAAEKWRAGSNQSFDFR